jgi:hypothetical protein
MTVAFLDSSLVLRSPEMSAVITGYYPGMNSFGTNTHQTHIKPTSNTHEAHIKRVSDLFAPCVRTVPFQGIFRSCLSPVPVLLIAILQP